MNRRSLFHTLAAVAASVAVAPMVKTAEATADEGDRLMADAVAACAAEGHILLWSAEHNTAEHMPYGYEVRPDGSYYTPMSCVLCIEDPMSDRDKALTVRGWLLATHTWEPTVPYVSAEEAGARWHTGTYAESTAV